MNISARPVLRYPGGKWRCANWIISHFPRHEVYVELFGGGGSVLMRKPPSRTEIYNEIDSQIVNVFRVLRDESKAKKLTELLDLTPFAVQEYQDCYAPPIDDVDAARKVICRSFFGIGSDSVFKMNGFRRGFKNKQLDSKNAFASYSECIPYFIERLRDVIIENLDWADVIKIYDSPKTLFYVDPPYLKETRTSRTVKYQFEFTKSDHIELANTLNACKGNVILSGYPSDLYTQLFEGWFATSKSTTTILGLKRIEKIWIKRQERTLFL